jgi:phosphate:Na+ symporter
MKDHLISQLLGGIGLFLLGVFLVTDGLKASAGQRLNRVLGRLTGRPLNAFGFGAVLTVLVQSSSATTLATLGFVSAGILNFSQSIGIVIGASLGTTTTGWLVALGGLKYGFSTVAWPLVGLGALARLLFRDRKAGVALAVAGFGLMFAGIDILQGGMSTLSQRFSLDGLPSGSIPVRLLLVATGIILTLLTQSSAAAVAATLSAFHAGVLNLEQGACLVIGASVGTTFTSAIVAVGATTPVKRTAVAHILFGFVAGMLGFLLIPAFIHAIHAAETSWRIQAESVVLAAFHSAFTAAAALLVLPAVRPFASIVERLVPNRGPALTRHLDASLAELPEVAIEAVRLTLLATLAELFSETRSILTGAAGSRRHQLAAIHAAVDETRRFLGSLSLPGSRSDAINSRVATLQALDHVGQMAIVVNRLHDRADTRVDDDRALATPKRLVLDILETGANLLHEPSDPAALDTLQNLASQLADQRRRERIRLFEFSARGEVFADTALHTLDALRWLDAIGYHAWRALHGLRPTGAQPQDPLPRTTRHDSRDGSTAEA